MTEINLIKWINNPLDKNNVLSIYNIMLEYDNMNLSSSSYLYASLLINILNDTSDEYKIASNILNKYKSVIIGNDSLQIDNCENFVNDLQNYKPLQEASYYNNDERANVPDENKNIDRLYILEYLRLKYDYKSYLEIGCRDDDCFSNTKFEKVVGVDPNTGGTLRMTSDEYFYQHAENFDIIFIDGLHWSEQVNRDIENSLKFLNEGGTILLHDCLPLEEASSIYPYDGVVGAWNGDVWKSIVLTRTSDEIKTCVLNADWGLGVIQVGVDDNKLEFNEGFSIGDIGWSDYLNNKEKWLNIKNFDEFLLWLN